MVKVSVAVGIACFETVVAESIRRALEIAEDRYPGAGARVVFPLDPDAFFAVDPARTASIELDAPPTSAG